MRNPLFEGGLGRSKRDLDWGTLRLRLLGEACMKSRLSAELAPQLVWAKSFTHFISLPSIFHPLFLPCYSYFRQLIESSRLEIFFPVTSSDLETRPSLPKRQEGGVQRWRIIFLVLGFAVPLISPHKVMALFTYHFYPLKYLNKVRILFRL